MRPLWPIRNLLSQLRRLKAYRIVTALSASVVLAAVTLFILILLANARRLQHERLLLAALWQDYIQHVWDPTTGRTIDAQNADRTTSESQGYVLLRAVWEDDRSTFASAWQWTINNLSRPDGLFSWQWGKRPDGSWGVRFDDGGQASASDADTDIALALLMAGTRWNNVAYTAAAHKTIAAIWNNEVIFVGTKPYLAADDLEPTGTSPEFIINPSYMAPYTYRIFARVDPTHDWGALVDTSYAVLQQSGQHTLGTSGSSGLPPDWAAINRTSGALSPSPNPAQDTDFGFDAFRTVWRVTLDWQWFHRPEAIQTLRQFGLLSTQWHNQHRLVAIYHHDGQPAADYTQLAFYGGVLGYFDTFHASQAQDIITSQFSHLIGNDNRLVQPLRYYDNNWVWFGLALDAHQLPNLAQTAGST